VKERPILMSGPMVLATLREVDPKTQTRRVLDEKRMHIFLPQGIRGDGPFCHIKAKAGRHKAMMNRLGAVSALADDGTNWLGVKPNEFSWLSPYGVPGDRLWVREAFKNVYDVAGDLALKYRADGQVITRRGALSRTCATSLQDRRWTPSIFMPRSLSRITLEVVRSWPERVQDISEADAVAEGTRYWLKTIDNEEQFREVVHKARAVTLKYARELCSENGWTPRQRTWYAVLWDSINAKRDYGWDVNPWVWVIEFKRVEEPK